MNKTAKGSLAAGAAAVLLLGGAGSLAYWSDSAVVDGGQVNSGFLTLDAVPVIAAAEGVTQQDCTVIKYAAGTTDAGDTVNNFVPGDVVSTECTFVIGAEGDNLAATPTIPATVEITGAGASFVAEVAATYELGTPRAAYTGSTPITEDNDGDELVATITVTFPYGTDQDGSPIENGNDTQNVNAILDDLTVTLTQDDPNA
ncbi:MAG: alternate-type signal peptide domain-containing protein [Nocardioides sp.]